MKVALFAGQGAQTVGMGKDLAEAYPECAALFAEADQILGYSLSSVIFDGPMEELTKTNVCQPAIFVVSAAAYTAFCKENPNVGQLYNVIVARSKDKDNPVYKKVVEAYHTQQTAKKLMDVYKGAFTPVWAGSENYKY